ncbi:MAG: hypothetical protein CMK09_04105 [Ponticaulis sp.]|nr:hypothetical protein [Ponticaulis sp.]
MPDQASLAMLAAMVKAVEIARCSSVEEAVVLCGFLEASGIPAAVADFNMAINQWIISSSQYGRVLVPESSKAEARLLVMERMTEAREILREEFGDLDETSYRRDRWKAWIWLIFAAWPTVPILLVILIGLQRFRRREPILGLFRKVERRSDKLFAPFPIRDGKPADR